MPLQPRFRRVAALDRRFVDRDHILQRFDQELLRIGAGPRVLNLTGVGGIGKSRLLRELSHRATAQDCRTALLDLQVPAMRQHEDALAVLRTDLGRQGVAFDRFDIAYAVLWQRVHPHLKITEADLPFVEESEVLSQILGEVSGVPVFGTAVGLARLARRAASRAKERRVIKLDETLNRIDELTNAEVLDAVTYLFAEDLRAANDRSVVVFVDAYEALVSTTARAGTVGGADVWLRDLIAQLDTGLVVVASREPLRWEEYDREWKTIIYSCPVDGLPMSARLALLAEAGVERSSAVAEASQGVPFYLHLAMDTRQKDSRETVVSSEEILQRFLNHVAPSEVRLLELLSIARVFDYEIFRDLADAYRLPADRMTWESLVAYSFVYPAGFGGLRLHQLMAQALRARLSEQVESDIHRRLRALWDERAERSGAQVMAFREAAYHGIRGRTIDATKVLWYADQAIRSGGKRAGDGVLADLNEVSPHGPFADVALCLATEAAITMGDAARATSLTELSRLPALDRVEGARLAIAAAHARRIAGDARAAGEIYREVWTSHRGAVRSVAGLWIADMHMWQGQFASAFDLISEIENSCPDDDPVLHGDVIRLAHLGYRFHLNFAESERELERAERYYQQAGTVIGLANTGTNYVELMALVDPIRAVRAAPRAIDAQQELAASHELGKTHTAVAIAEVRLGDISAAATSFDVACGYLDRAGYRSGRARAELFRALLYIRQDRLDDAIQSIVWAVGEFNSIQAYPTLVIAAAHVLDRLDHHDLRVSRVVDESRRRVQPLDSLAALEIRTAELVASLLGD